MAKEQSEWVLQSQPSSASEMGGGLQPAKTQDLEKSELKHVDTSVIKSTIKSTDEVIEEMRTWLRTGIAPDGCRMMTDEAWQWHQDYYHGTLGADIEHECLPEGSTLEYRYWETPFLSHVGNINLVMMHSQVEMPDGTFLPADRLRAQNLHSKRLQNLAKKRVEVELRERNRFVHEAISAHK